MIWKNEKGDKILIFEMTNEHIINAIRWLVNDPSFGSLKKDGFLDVEWVAHLSQELASRKQ